MIKTKKELYETINKDKEAMGLAGKSYLKLLLRGRGYEVMLMKYIILIRKTELYENLYIEKKNLFNLVRYWLIRQYSLWRSHKIGIYIAPNTIGAGMRLIHPGYRWIDKYTNIGENCTILPRVLIGKRRPNLPPQHLYWR